jgi:hypothetical protein
MCAAAIQIFMCISDPIPKDSKPDTPPGAWRLRTLNFANKNMTVSTGLISCEHNSFYRVNIM